MKSRFSRYFSTILSPNRVLTPLKSASKIMIFSFVNPSKIFVWGAYYLTKEKSIQLERATHRIMSSHACVFVNPSCNYFTKDKSIQLERRWHPCGKQHFREIPTPDFVSKCTNQACYLVEAIVVKSLQNPAWVFRGNVVSHMVRHTAHGLGCLSDPL